MKGLRYRPAVAGRAYACIRVDYPHAKGAKDGKGILKFGKGKAEREKKFEVKVKNCGRQRKGGHTARKAPTESGRRSGGRSRKQIGAIGIFVCGNGSQ